MKKCYLAFLALSFSFVLNAQLVINEFMASNSATLKDESGEYEDWIEIYNTSDNNISLNGFYLTDNFNNKLKFAIPGEITITAKGYVVFFADDNTSQGELHTNFKLSSDGEQLAIFQLSGADTIVIDSLTFPNQSDDISYGRFPDGINYFEFFTTSTPGSANNSSNLEGIAPPAAFSLPSGFYTGVQEIVITSELTDAQIRYTTDGSEPTASSAIYTSAISSNKTIIIKAKVFANDYVPSKTMVATYFINEHFCSFNESDRLPVVSVSAQGSDIDEVLTFFDNEKMVSIELFEPNGNSVINQYAGIKVFGNASRALAQKSIAVFARSKYGKGSFDYKFFDDKPFVEYESFVMRNCGSDWSLTYFRDALCQALVRGPMKVPAQGSKHAILYLNGELYGIVDLKEKVNEHYIEQNYNVDPENIDMLNHPSSGEEVVKGDITKYNEFNNYMVNSDLSSPILYDRLGRLMDIPNFRDMQIAQIYIANIDMFFNSKYWRERVNYGKWRWIMYDTELSFGQGDYSYADDYGTIPSSNTLRFASENYGGSGWPYLRPWSSAKLLSILKNQTFRNDFIQTFAVHINTTFNPAHVLHMIDSMQLRISKEIPSQIQVYGGRTVDFNPYGTHFSTIQEWEYYINIMRDFAVQRPEYMRTHILDKFTLSGTYNLVPRVNMANAGSVFIQDIQVPVDSSGIYFDNIPLRVKAVARNGYRFLKWQGISGVDSLLPEITITTDENVSLKAVFATEENVMITEVLYKQGAGNSEFIEILNPKHTTAVDLSNYSLSGDISFTFPDSTYLMPGEYLAVVADTENFSGVIKKYFEWSSGNLSDSNGIIILKDNLGLLVDSINYANNLSWPLITENNSIELISADLDNNLGSNWKKCISQGGAPGIPSFSEDIKSLVINEFMAINGNIIADENGECNDWIELFNPTDKEINFGGLYLTNDLSDHDMYQIPMNYPQQTTIKPHDYLLLWADGEPGEGVLHLNFKLNGSNRAIGISSDGKSFFDSVTFGAQSTNISLARHPNGIGDFKQFSSPTPAYKNSMAPEITSEPELYCQLGATYKYDIIAVDSDDDDLFLSYYEKPYWASFTVTGNGTATLTGKIPSGVTKVFTVKIAVFDGFTEPVVQEFKITRGLPPTGVVDESLAENQFSCYPNPSTGLVTIALSTNSPSVELIITNVAGQIVMIKQLNPDKNELAEDIDLSDQKKGVYYITIRAEEGISTQKLILF